MRYPMKMLWAGYAAASLAASNDSPNALARTTFEGTWEYVKGTGQYATAKGKETYQGQFLAKDRYSVRWRGEYRR